MPIKRYADTFAVSLAYAISGTTDASELTTTEI